MKFMETPAVIEAEVACAQMTSVSYLVIADLVK